MGGGKKKGISQMDKAQKVKEEKPSGKKKGKAAVEKKTSSFSLREVDDENLVSELGKMRAITPSAIASTYGIPVSAAKDLLKQLERKNLVNLAEGCGRIKIYRLAAAA